MLDNLIDNKKLEKYNEHITRLENLFKSVIITGNYEEYRLAPCLMLFNFINLLRGVTVLDSNHMISSGNIIIRSMFEILLDFLYCETNKKLYLRFGEYQDVSRVLLYKSVPQDVKNQVDKEKYNSITFPNFENFKVKYNIKDDKKELSNWCGKSIFQRVKIVSKRFPEILDLYYNIYKLNCDYTHNYAGTITQYVNYNNKTLNANYSNKYNKNKFHLIKQVNSLADIFYNEFEKQYANVALSNLEF